MASGDLLDLLYLGVSADGIGGSSSGVAGVDDGFEDVVAHRGCVVHRVAVIDPVGQVIAEGTLITSLS